MTPPNKRRPTFLITECIHFGEGEGWGVSPQADGLTSSEGALNRGPLPNHPAIRWFSAWKNQGFPTRNHSFWLPTRGTRGEFGARNENHVCKKVAKVSKKWRKTCFLCWWFNGSCIFVAGAFYGWSLSFSTDAYFCGHYWALTGLAHQTIEHGHLKKMPWKDTFFFHLFSFPTLWTSVPFLKFTGWKFLFSWM